MRSNVLYCCWLKGHNCWHVRLSLFDQPLFFASTWEGWRSTLFRQENIPFYAILLAVCFVGNALAHSIPTWVFCTTKSIQGKQAKVGLHLKQGRNDVKWRPRQEARLAARSNLRSFGSKYTALKKVFVTMLGLFGAPQWFDAPIMIRRPRNCDPSLHLWSEEVVTDCEVLRAT